MSVAFDYITKIRIIFHFSPASALGGLPQLWDKEKPPAGHGWQRVFDLRLPKLAHSGEPYRFYSTAVRV
jgi:hypothetical protein